MIELLAAAGRRKKGTVEQTLHRGAAGCLPDLISASHLTVVIASSQFYGVLLVFCLQSLSIDEVGSLPFTSPG